MAQKVLAGGTIRRAGTYWDREAWSMVMLRDDGDVLPGTAENQFIRIPFLLVLMLVPAMGALYVMFLPLAGFLITGDVILKKMRRQKPAGTAAG